MMKYIQLIHDSRLEFDSSHLNEIPLSWNYPKDVTSVLSFRSWQGRAPDSILNNINATSRLNDIQDGHVCMYGLDTDSSLAPLIVWDIAHALPLNGKISVVSPTSQHILQLEYYRNSFVVQHSTAEIITYQKVKPLLIESDKGLTRWTFGLPTGPGDATGLNACVKRILELEVPEFEIVLCGRPGPGFKYFDRVRIVGEELSKPPVLIGKKKNVIAENASYENLCILHDRVFLPKDFYTAVQRFGDFYPLTSFQSLWFEDPYNLICKRYSDGGRPFHSSNEAIPGEDFYSRDMAGETGIGFVFTNALRYSKSNYNTGSMYMAKRSLWKSYPQSDTLQWAQYEDVEHGLRISKCGIPSRFNPYSFTQSLFARLALFSPGILYETPSGRAVQSVSPLEAVNFARKPLMKISHKDALMRLLHVANKYIPSEIRDRYYSELNRPGDSTADWIRKIGLVIYGARIPYGEESIREFIVDFEKMIIGDNLSVGFTRYLLNLFALHGTAARDHFFEHSFYIKNMILYRRFGSLHYQSMSEFFPENTWKLRLATSWTAKRIARHNGLILYHPDGSSGYENSILNSTPFREYYEPNS